MLIPLAFCVMFYVLCFMCYVYVLCFMCYVYVLCFMCYVCSGPVYCVPYVASVTGLSILNFPFGFI